jgi:hypothetical protein
VEEEAVHLTEDRKQAETNKLGPSITFKGMPQLGAFPLGRFYLLKFSEPPKIAPPAGNQAVNT